MSPVVELSGTDRRQLHYGKEALLVPEHLPAPGSSAVLVPEFYLYLPVDHEVLLATPATPPQELLAELVA